MAWTSSLTWSTGELVSSSKLNQMIANHEWAKSMADRQLLASWAAHEKTAENLGGTGLRIAVAPNGLAAKGTGASGVTGTQFLEDWNISTIYGAGSTHVHAIDDIQIEGYISGGWEVMVSTPFHFVTPNEAAGPNVRHTYLTAVIYATLSFNQRFTPSWACHIDFWGHNELWASSSWSPEV